MAFMAFLPPTLAAEVLSSVPPFHHFYTIGLLRKRKHTSLEVARSLFLQEKP